MVLIVVVKDSIEDSFKRTFADIPVKDYIDSIWNDIADAEEEITDNPMYLILNPARVLVYLKDGLVLSKKEDGEWELTISLKCNIA